MTPQKYYFMLLLYACQNAKFNMLYELLKSKGVVENDDLIAYDALFKSEKLEEVSVWLAEAWAACQASAHSLGITTGLESGITPPRRLDQWSSVI